MAEKAFNRSEKATPFKLRKAREKGQTAKSMLTNQLISLVIGGLTLYWLQDQLARDLQQQFYTLLHLSGDFEFSLNNWQKLANLLILQFFELLLPLLLIIVLAVIIANLFQSGFIWSFEPLKPDVKRLNPVDGFKRLFNLKMLYELCKNLLLCGAIALVIYLNFSTQLSTFYHLSLISPKAYGTIISEDIIKVIKSLLVVISIAAVIDIIFVRKRFAKEMMMSKHELKDEYKEQQGNPEIKQKRKSLLRQSYQQTAALGEVKSADIVITNPTHLAVALKYEQGKMIAPKIVARGQAAVARRIRKLAHKYHVYITENKPLARKLYRQKVGSYIEISEYEVVAQLLKDAYLAKGHV
ncbi:EscU/YscU/HrcU family type III secretion system export apparatus switch protein [Cysteiniphilum sp. QT6929]|uniref:EscU/YscU/HrcU family type III secretion system export apparatus switch protein n=1 Tax=Cysteiniphilum sp. QT6929 TaxID=2975055 RepID=UPI0024B35F68|nr:EscU/YscU/HrcU family type III secretion system export apparatus switch protein [Cysteiniphilum sp. QT6929]WHN66086.1 EscU/YscU/HrcU family type III secretion system export apparatus switch protein [Cysteiniphilum sp. QT6929]